MPCVTGDVAANPGQEITDLLFLHPFTAVEDFLPTSKAELVAAVARSTRDGHSLRALGSNYSLSLAAVADSVIDTSALNLFISQPYLPGTAPLDASRIRGTGSDYLSRICAGDARAAGRHYIHVEAGIKIKDLLADLGACGLSLPTMGAGGGQSLAGALSTSTHGADFLVPPPVEWVRAVHLVGSGGQEWWIAPSGGIFADQRASQLPDWCHDAYIVAADDAFNAVRVGVGRMGVIYSVILEVVPNFTLIEVNFEHRWSDIRDQLVNSSVTRGSPAGIFDAPMTDLDSGWFRTQVLERVAYPDDPLLQNAWFSYKPGPPIRSESELQYFDDNPGVYLELLSRPPGLGGLGVPDLAAELRGGAEMKLHHMNLGISLAETERCWITRRWRRDVLLAKPLNLAPGPDDQYVAAVKANKTNPPGMVAMLQSSQPSPSPEFWFVNLVPFLLGNFISGVANVAALVQLVTNEQLQRLSWYLNEEMPRVAADGAAHQATSVEVLVSILHEMENDPIIGKGFVADLAAGIMAGQVGPMVRAGPASGGLHQNVLDKHDYGLDGAESADSVELLFDAASNVYLDFIDTVVDIANRHSVVYGYIGIRFTPAATALIAMQQFPLTVSVEVTALRTRLKDIFAGFWNDIHEAAATHGGIPHWGQEFRLTASDLTALYGERIDAWRDVLTDLLCDSPDVFSTAFSRDKGLEPSDDELALFMLALEGAAE